MKRLILIFVAFSLVQIAFAQVGIGTETPNRSSQLDVVSADRGILIPRVVLQSSTDQVTIRNGNVNSLMVFNTNTASDITPGYYYWHEEKWYKIATTDDFLEEIITTLIEEENGVFIYTSEDGTQTTIDISEAIINEIISRGDIYQEILNLVDANETVTILQDNDNGTYTYFNEEDIDAEGNIIGAGITIDIVGEVVSNIQNQGAIYNEIVNLIGTNETLTTLVDNGDGSITYTNENGDAVTFNLLDGAAGADGKSAYELWLDLGNTGSVQDFINSLRGADGQDGQSITDVEIDNGELIVTIFDPETGTSTPHNLGNVAGMVGADGVDGKSIEDVTTTDVFDPITNELIGTEITFLDGNNDPVGNPFTVLHGQDGVDGVGVDTTVDNGNGSYTIFYTDGTSITIDIVGDVVTNIMNEGDIYNQIINLIQSEESTTTIVDGKNTTVESEVTSNNTEYKVNVAIADGTSLGVVKEAAVNPTVKINEEGELSVELSNLNAVVETAVDYVALLTDATILGNANGGNVNITLPAATPDSKGKKFTVKKLDANEQNYIYVIGNIAGLSGQYLYTAIPYTGWDFISDGTKWHIINSF